MPIETATLLIYISAIVLMMSSPGPSHLLMLSTSLEVGPRRAAFTAAGDLTANAIQMTLATLGLAAVIATSREAFLVIKWAGVAYLLWLAWKTLHKKTDETVQSSPPRAHSLFLRGFLTSMTNPKAVIFFAALFPQFLDTTRPVASQALVLGIIYILVDGTFLTAYGWFARAVKRLLRNNARWLNRIGAGGLTVAAVFLAFKDIRRTTGD